MVSVLKKVSVLGLQDLLAKGLEVISKLSDKFKLYAISCNENISLFHDQIIKYKPKVAVITNHEKYNEFLNDHGDEITYKNSIWRQA